MERGVRILVQLLMVSVLAVGAWALYSLPGWMTGGL
jgi:hypothetical protein